MLGEARGAASLRHFVRVEESEARDIGNGVRLVCAQDLARLVERRHLQRSTEPPGPHWATRCCVLASRRHDDLGDEASF
jgi:hypothetical protein